MKLILGILLLTTLTSCGVVEGLSKNCGNDINEFCTFAFGDKDKEQDKQIADNTFKNNEQDARLKALEEQNLQLISSMESISNDLEYLSQDVENNAAQIAITSASLTTLQGNVNANLVTLLALNTTVTTLNGNVVALDSALSKTIVATIDPCNDYPGHFDEVILKTRDGKFLAYFEDGGKRFLSLLSPGVFVTTDKQACIFTVTNNGTLTF
jgi:hypothetical protein